MDHGLSEYNCDFCPKTFELSVVLKNHVRKCHLNMDKFKCYHCKYTTNMKFKLSSHIQRHFNVKHNHRKQYACKLCTTNAFQSRERQSMLQHYSDEHGVPVEPQKLVFNSQDELKKWTSKLESSEVCKFVPPGGARRTKNKLITTLRCFRDGFYQCVGQGKRRLKWKKSSKIGGICPASITASQDLCTGVVTVNYIAAHVGHDAEVDRLMLTPAEKKEITAKIVAGVPFDTILDDVRASLSSENECSKLHLLSRKDLWNILQSYKSNCVAVMHEAVNVTSWVTEMQQNSNMVRFYKSQNSVSPIYQDLQEMDFILIIANDIQLALLKEYGPKCVCFDSTHGLNQSTFDLSTVLVLTEANQGFPCGYMVSNRSDVQIMKIFVETLKRGMDFSFQPEVMMTDMSENFFNGWCQVMPAPKQALFSCWHVDDAWRNNLKKVSDPKKTEVVYKYIRTLLEHLDRNSFPVLLNNTISKLLSDADTKEFGAYFKAEFSNNFNLWSFCTRKYNDINSNRQLESMLKTFKQLFLKETKVKRLDKGLHVLARYTRDKLFDILSTTKGNLTPKIVATRQRHRASLALQTVPVIATEAGWTISSQHGQEIYEVTRHNENCFCDDICEECRVCVHTFKCTCPDSVVNSNICRHIHRVSAFLRNDESSSVSVATLVLDDGDFLDCSSDIVISEGEVAFSASLPQHDNSEQSTSDDALNNRKEKLLQQFKEILDVVCCHSDAEIVGNALDRVIPAIQASHE